MDECVDVDVDFDRVFDGERSSGTFACLLACCQGGRRKAF